MIKIVRAQVFLSSNKVRGQDKKYNLRERERERERERKDINKMLILKL